VRGVKEPCLEVVDKVNRVGTQVAHVNSMSAALQQ